MRRLNLCSPLEWQVLLGETAPPGASKVFGGAPFPRNVAGASAKEERCGLARSIDARCGRRGAVFARRYLPELLALCDIVPPVATGIVVGGAARTYPAQVVPCDSRGERRTGCRDDFDAASHDSDRLGLRSVGSGLRLRD